MKPDVHQAVLPIKSILIQRFQKAVHNCLLKAITHPICYFTISQKYIGQIPLPFYR